MSKNYAPITSKIAFRVLETVDAGLVGGKVGDPIPGKMCVEAAVAYAMGEDHNDKPKCVHLNLREFKIALNDYDYSSYGDRGWGSNKARSKGLRRIAIAQLGSAGKLDWELFVNDLASLINERFPSKEYKLFRKKTEVLLRKSLAAKTAPEYQASINNLKDLLEGDTDYDDNYNTLVFTEYSDDPESFVDDCVTWLKRTGVKAARRRLQLVADMAVECLVKQKIPGTKFLYLTKEKGKGARKAKVRRKK